MKRIYLSLLTLCLTVLTLSAQTTVTVQSNTFTPQNITISVGETVTFENIGGFHNVNGTQTTFPMNPESFGNGAAASAPWTYQHTFTIPGTYDYQCDPHESLGMTGTITVEGGGGADEDIVITEIMYNPPESGTDSLEFIEIYNNGADAVNLNGWSLSGVTFTFPDINIGAGEYLVTAVNSSAMSAVLGVEIDLEWESGGLSNGGETLQVINADGAVVDEVSYDDGGDWPESPDGGGRSLVLCDPSSDNTDAANWIAALTDTGAEIDGVSIFANPGAAAGCPDDPVISFLDTEATVDEGVGTVTARVAVNFGNDNPTSVDVVLSTLTDATFEEDFMYETVTLVFQPGVEQDTQTVTLTIVDDIEAEDSEIVALALVSPTNDALIGDLNFIVTIEDNDTETDYSEVTIGTATQIDADGVGTYVDSLVQIQGVVYGVNMRPAGLQFTVIDENNDGIGLFFNSGDLGYTVNEGDEVIIQGTIGQFNGLLQISPDNIVLVDTDNMLFDPTIVTELGEDTESQLVTLQDVMLVDPNDWTGAGSGFNVEVTDGTNTYTVRIDADVDLYNMEAPTGTFNVTGLGGQFDNSSPFLDGYQLLPRYVADIDPYNGTEPMEPEFPVYDIAEVTGIDENGVADSLNTTCTLTGVVHGVDFRGGDGVQFFIHDGTDGIAVFSGDISYYEVTEGDEVTMEGSIGQFNGLTQMNPDTIVMNSAGNALTGPVLVPGLGEGTESELVTIEVIFNDINQWMPGGSGFNMDATVVGSGDQITVRIDNDTELFAEAAYPYMSSLATVTGLGSQFDNSSPFLEGYQILPRYLTDIVAGTISTEDPTLAEKIRIYPNPAQDVLKVDAEDLILDEIVINNVLGQPVLVFEDGFNRLNISDLRRGVYTVTFKTGNRVYSRQLIKQE